ncbi:MAG: IS110 family transposase [Patescibacteria group bacterium]
MQAQVKKLDFTGQNIFAGLDVHLKQWTVTIRTETLTHKTFVQPPKPEVLYEYLNKNFPGGTYHSAYEAGFCGFWIHNKLKLLGINSMVANAADIPTTDKEKKHKIDPRDSRKIARSLSNGDLEPIYVPSIKILEDRSLIRTRATLVKDLTRFKNRIKSFLYFYGIEYPLEFSKSESHWSKKFMNWLEDIKFSEKSGKNALNILIAEAKSLRLSLLQTNKLIRELSTSEAYKIDVSLLRTIPGIGLITSCSIITELETLNRFSNFDKLCGFIGLVPSTKSSGEKEIIGDITSRGHSVLRSAIIESSWVAIRLDPSLMKCYLDYCKRMEPNKAIIRIAKKLLNRIRYVLKNKQPYKCLIVK